jgi:MFS transporter, DHA1 family, multidrug resistance protein
MGFAMCVPFLPPFVRALGVHGEKSVLIWSGWLSTAAGLVMFFVAPVWGILADRHGRKLMVMRSMFGGMIVLGLMAYVQNVHQLLFLRMMQGLLTGTVAASVALVSSVVPTKRAGFALGLMQTAMYVGNALGPALGGQLAFAYGFRVPFMGAAGMLCVAGVLTAVGVREEFDPRTEEETTGGAGTIWQVLGLSGFATLAGVLFLVMFAGSFVGPIMPLYIEKLAGGAPGAATKLTGYILSIGGVAAAISATVLGRLGDRLGYGRVLTICTLLSGLTLIPYAYCHSPSQLLFWRIMTCLTEAGTIPAVNALIRHIVPRHACGKAFGLTQSISCLGWAFGPLVGSSLAAQYGMPMPFLVVGCAFVGISVVVMRLMPGLMRQMNAAPADDECDISSRAADLVEAEEEVMGTGIGGT